MYPCSILWSVFFGTDRDSQGDPEGEGVASCTHIRDAPHGHLSQTRAYHSLQTHSKPTPHLYTSTRAAGSISNAMTAALSPLVPENLNEGHLVSLGLQLLVSLGGNPTSRRWAEELALRGLESQRCCSYFSRARSTRSF